MPTRVYLLRFRRQLLLDFSVCRFSGIFFQHMVLDTCFFTLGGERESRVDPCYIYETMALSPLQLFINVVGRCSFWHVQTFRSFQSRFNFWRWADGYKRRSLTGARFLYALYSRIDGDQERRPGIGGTSFVMGGGHPRFDVGAPLF